MIKEGDLVYLYKDPRRNYLLTAKRGEFHTDKGYIKVEDVIGRDFGEVVYTNLKEAFYILRPTLYEMIMKINRKTQIIYPKDAAVILTKATIFPGAKVIDVGAGSGAFTSALAHFVKPDGKVYAYERRKDLLENAIKNVKKNGLSDFVEFKYREVISGFDEKNVDFVMIDIGSPWELIEAAYSALKGGHRIASICPTYEQLTHTVFALEKHGFSNIETLEVLVRRILVRPNRTRPEQQMPSHTGFLVLASKITK